MSVEPTASAIYNQLCNEGNNKFVATLNRIRGACDALATANATLSYSQVGKMAVQLFGGPKTQSILNSAKHTSYIAARRREQHGSKLNTSYRTEPQPGAKYPSDDLDYKTRRYIDDLRQRNTTLELAMRELKNHVLTSTAIQPIDITRMINAGPKVEGSMAVETNLAPALGIEEKRILEQLLDDLAHKVPGVESYREKGIRLRTGEWLLPPDRYSLLKSLIER